ncbi:MAG: tripartite tricarboxylate transporter TctB family protein [Pseudomonadota bacterium]
MRLKDGKSILFGALILALGVWITFSDSIIKGGFSRAIPFMALPTTYLRLVGSILMILSLLMILSNFTFDKEFKPARTKMKASKVVVISFAALLIYVFAMNILGFLMSSIIVTGFLCLLYQYCDKNIEVGKKNSRTLMKYGIISLSFSIISVFILQFIFTFFLKANLPKFQLF